MAYYNKHNLFQFPPPHGGRLQRVQRFWMYTSISIPAPAWGATFSCQSHGEKWSISIPAPAWGATAGVRRGEARRDFNSRPRRGGDSTSSKVDLRQIISIPAPAWGATPPDFLLNPGRFYFNSRPRMGGDQPLYGDFSKLPISIPAPAWGATAKMSKLDWSILYIYAAFYFPKMAKEQYTFNYA